MPIDDQGGPGLLLDEWIHKLRVVCHARRHEHLLQEAGMPRLEELWRGGASPLSAYHAIGRSTGEVEVAESDWNPLEAD